MADRIGYPVVIRPSYVLGGRGMEIVADGAEVDRYIARLVGSLDRPSELAVSDKRPLLVDRYLTGAVEVDVDCLCDGRTPSSPASWSISKRPASTRATARARCRCIRSTARSSCGWRSRPRDLAMALKVVGLMNVQFAIKDRQIYILEVNPRASRTVPFVAKVIGAAARRHRLANHGGRSLSRRSSLKPQKLEHMSRSKKRCSRSRASSASIPCSGLK